MKQTRRCSGLAGAIVAAACAAALPAHAMAVLETNFSNVTCGETDAAGETFFSQCNGLSFAASVAPGETAFLRATLNYHYTDDGLPLPRPQGIQLDTIGRHLDVFNEAAVIYLDSSNCTGSRACLNRYPGNVNLGGTTFRPLILGLNDQPDDITGSVDLFVTLGIAADQSIGYSTGLFLSATPLVFSAPVPEPATVALMAAGLLSIGLWAPRRRAVPQPC
jgi:PEP-CTERM motif